MDQFMIYYMLQQPRPVGVLLFFFRQRSEGSHLVVAALTDNPKGGALARYANEIQENGCILT